MENNTIQTSSGEKKNQSEMTGDKKYGVTESLSSRDEKRLVRKVDLYLMPLLIISYGLQYLDKTSLSYSAILGLREDLNLHGQGFSWASGTFYIGYLAASYPISLGFVRFPLGRYLSVLIFLWGVVLTLHACAENYAGLMVLRTFLGIFESAISPGFSLITGMWYTPKEDVSRHSFWFAGNATASLIGSGIAYGILKYTGGFNRWKMLFLIFGLITVAWSVFLWFFLPDDPSTARFLTPTEREFASLRPKKFQRTTQTKKWDKGQFIETLKDVKAWWFLLFSFVICVPNGGTTSTILMGMPAAAFQLTTVILAALFTTYIRKSRLVAMVAIFLMAMAGILMVKLLPYDRKVPRLAGYWLVTAVAPAFPLMMSLFASNTLDSRRSRPLSLLSSSGTTAYTTFLTCYVISIVMAALFRVYLSWTNKRRDQAQDMHIDPEDHREIDLQADEELDHVDETDIQNQSFRYIL
ncbi:major facilitator superfamily domain-containing protein [Aspergillus desertorum]